MANKSSSKNNNNSKKKFIPISEIDNVLLPGRHPCQCEATVHELICNCLNCGRIVCMQEGLGECFTCGKKVITKQEVEEISRINREIAEFELKKKDLKKDQKKLASKSLKEIASSLIGIEQANDHKNKLLEYERTSEKRTKVIDDELDYFDLTRENWLSNEKREELKEKVDQLHEDKFVVDRRYELDFKTRQVVEVCKPKIENLSEEVTKLKEETDFKSDYEIVDFRQILDYEKKDVEPYYVENKEEKKSENQKNKSNKNQKSRLSMNKSSNILPNINLIRNRLQNSELFDSTDEGYCLSINQPFASLLIHEIKLHEGRSWLTTHRGPLWIHASAKSPRNEEIQEACTLFRLMLDNKSFLFFPDNYPLGCIIGRVNLSECLAQEEYQSRFGAGGYVEDPFVFIFNDIIKLKVDVPCSGKQKIFKLDKNIFKVVSSQITHTYGNKK